MGPWRRGPAEARAHRRPTAVHGQGTPQGGRMPVKEGCGMRSQNAVVAVVVWISSHPAVACGAGARTTGNATVAGGPVTSAGGSDVTAAATARRARAPSRCPRPWSAAVGSTRRRASSGRTLPDATGNCGVAARSGTTGAFSRSDSAIATGRPPTRASSRNARVRPAPPPASTGRPHQSGALADHPCAPLGGVPLPAVSTNPACRVVDNAGDPLAFNMTTDVFAHPCAATTASQ